MCYWAVNRVYYYPGAQGDDGNQCLDSSRYRWYANSIYNSSIDSVEYIGNGVLRRCLIGGIYNATTYNSSRCFLGYNYSGKKAGILTARGCKGAHNQPYYPGSYWKDSDYSFYNYLWSERFVYNSSVDSIKYGSCFGALRRNLSGGAATDTTHAGSRSTLDHSFGVYDRDSYAARGCNKSRVFSWG